MIQENTKTIRVLRLVMLLLGSRKYTIAELAEKMGIANRTVFRDIHEIKNCGIKVKRFNGRYQILQDDFLAFMKISPSHAEENTKLNGQTIKVLNLFGKLTEAIDRKKVVCLYDYKSSSGEKSLPKKIEPFLLSQNDQTLWAYDTAANKCKQYKLLRMSHIDTLEEGWQFEHKHKQPFTDIFRFSASEPIDTIKLRLQGVALNVFLEEYPKGIDFRSNKKENLFKIPVADFRGAGRFVLGLMDVIEVLGSEAFRNYLRDVTKKYGRF